MYTIDNTYLNACNNGIISTYSDRMYLSAYCPGSTLIPSMPDSNRSVRLLHKTNLLKIKSI